MYMKAYFLSGAKCTLTFSFILVSSFFPFLRIPLLIASCPYVHFHIHQHSSTYNILDSRFHGNDRGILKLCRRREKWQLLLFTERLLLLVACYCYNLLIDLLYCSWEPIQNQYMSSLCFNPNARQQNPILIEYTSLFSYNFLNFNFSSKGLFSHAL